MTNRRKEWKKVLLFLLIVLLVIVIGYLSLVGFALRHRGYFSQPSPLDSPNSLWECQECDMYCIVDGNSCSCGAIEQNGTVTYLGFFWYSDTGFAIYKCTVNEMGQLISRSDVGMDKLADGYYRYKMGVATVTCRYPYSFRLWETEEPVTLTFVRQGSVAPVDFRSGIDPIRRMEVIE